MQFKLVLTAVLFSTVCLLTNCKPAAKTESKTNESQDTTQKATDTSVKNNSAVDTTAIVDNAVNMSSELIRYVDELHKEFDGLTSPFEAKYAGFDIGDYPHITFKHTNGKEYDFGSGENSFSPYKEEDFLTEKSKYEGKMFKVSWEWKMSTFNCCEGEMDLMSAKVPCIVKLELVK